MRIYLKEDDTFTAPRSRYLIMMIWVVLPLVVLVGHVGVPLFTRLTPYWKNPTVIPASLFLLISILSLLLLRKNKYLGAVHLYVYGFIFAPFVAVILDQVENPNLAGLMVGGVIVSSVLFPKLRAVIISGIITVLSLVSLFFFYPVNIHPSLFYNICVNTTLISLIIIFKKVNDYFEEIKRQKIAAINQTLTEQTSLLEEEIEKRKEIEIDLKSAKEKAEESNQLKSAFLASMNHELRTPLNHIIGFSSLIESEEKLEDIRTYANTINDSGQKLLAIIEDIFSLAMTENMSISLRLEPIKIQDLFDQLVSIQKMSLSDAGKMNSIVPEFYIDNSLLNETFIIDKYKVIQVITNFIHNGVKFTDSGSIKIEVLSNTKGKIDISVQDTGIGIAKEKQEVIFEFFRQENHDISIRYEGLGIGLAISKRIADAMNARIILKSEQGKGSRFTLSLLWAQ